MRKRDVLAAVGQAMFPRGLDDGFHTLDDAIPDVEIRAFYPSFQWVDQDRTIRQDEIILLTDRALIRCRVKTEGFSTVDFMGRLDVRQTSRSVEVVGVSLNSVVEWTSAREEGPRSRGSEAAVARSLRIVLAEGALGKELEIPYAHDLEEADHNDNEEVGERIERFTHALVDILARGESG